MRTAVAAAAALCLALAALVAHQGRVALLHGTPAELLGWGELGRGMDATVRNPTAAGFSAHRPASEGFRHFLTRQAALRRPRVLRKASMLATSAARAERGSARGSSATPSLEKIAAAYRRAEAVNRRLERSIAPSPPHAAAAAAAAAAAVVSKRHVVGDGQRAEVDALNSAASTLETVTKSMAGSKFVATPSHLSTIASSLATLSDSINKVQPARLPALKARKPTQTLRAQDRQTVAAAPHESVAAREKRIEEDVLLHFDRLGIQRLRAAQARKATAGSGAWFGWIRNL